MKPSFLLLLFFLTVSFTSRANRLVLYDAPPGAESANDYEVFVNGQRVFVYNTRPAAFAYFSFSGRVEVQIICPGEIYSYDIRPKRLAIPATTYRKEIRFTLDNPANLSVEINKNIKRPLFLFANPPEQDVPDRNAKNVRFYEKGKVHNIGQVNLGSDQTVYIEGGAIVRGSFIASGKNIKIIGRGILDNSRYAKGEVRPIEIQKSDNVLLDGFIITESRHWTCGAYASKNVTYHNLKIVSDNDWDDGIDIVGSKKVVVDGCFIRTKDDCIAIKSGIGYFTKFENGFTVDDVVVKNSVMWNGVWGNALEIGFETRTDTIKNITFLNIDIIHTEGPEGTFTIHNGDRAYVKNIRYEDIRVEDARGYLIDFKILDASYTKDKQKGFVDGVYLKNIQVEGEVFPTSLIMGFNERHKISNVTIDHVFIHGKKVTSTYAGMIAIIHAENVVYK